MNVKAVALLLALVLAARRLSGGSSGGRLAYPNGNGANRNCDPQGCGHYGAPRGSRVHRGHDFIVRPGQQVLSPLEGTVSRYPVPYANDSSYQGIEIKGAGQHLGLTVKMLYVSPTAHVGASVRPGQAVAVAQDISAKYGGGMLPHVHLELWRDGSTIDPIPYFR